MLSGYARHSIAPLTSAIGAVTSSADVRVQFLSHAEVLARALNRIRIRIQTRKIARKRDDVMLVAERLMRRYYLHCRVYTCP